MNYIPSPSNGNISSVVNVLTYGADPTGVADSAPAFRNAIASFGVDAGTVLVPDGTYRFADLVSIKSAVTITGLIAHGGTACRIMPDPGVTAFMIERYNTPAGTTNPNGGDYSSIKNLRIEPSAKAPNWLPNHLYSVNDVTRTGTGRGEDFRKHYRVIQSGTSASSGSGPNAFQFWTPSTVYYVGERRMNNTDQKVYTVTTGGTSSSSGTGPVGAGTGITDGTVVWDYFSPANPDACVFVDGSVKWAYLQGGGSAIKMRARCALENVTIYRTSGCGLHIEATDREMPNSLCNANGWSIRNFIVYYSDGHGIYVAGSDTNGGWAFGGDMFANGAPTSDFQFTGTGYNIFESSELGNAWEGIQMASGGLGSIYVDCIGSGPTFTGCYQEGSGGGQNYVINSGIVVGGGLSVSEFAPNSGAAVLASGAYGGQGLAQVVRGFIGAVWQPNTPYPIGYRVENDSPTRIYEATVDNGVTAGFGGPTGTSGSIVDGSQIWAFVAPISPSGIIEFGSQNASSNDFLTFRAPREVSKSSPFNYLRYKSYTLQDLDYAMGFEWGSGQVGGGMLQTVQDSTLLSWPMQMRPSVPVFNSLWLNSSRICFGEVTYPLIDVPVIYQNTWNPGDKMFYKGAATVSGGPEGVVCVTGGTIGTYTGGRTVSSGGGTTITVSGGSMGGNTLYHDFKIGDHLLINGVTTAVVYDSTNNGQTLTMSTGIPAGSGLSVAFVPPVFRFFGITTNSSGNYQLNNLDITNGFAITNFLDDSATTGNRTVNKSRGINAFAGGSSSITITNSHVTATSTVLAVLQTNDATAIIKNVVPTSGSFDINLSAAATGTTKVAWTVIN